MGRGPAAIPEAIAQAGVSDLVLGVYVLSGNFFSTCETETDTAHETRTRRRNGGTWNVRKRTRSTQSSQGAGDEKATLGAL